MSPGPADGDPEGCRLPLVSCIMPTRGRRAYVGQAIEHFLRQDYANRELVIIDDGDDPIGDLLPADPRIRYEHRPGKASVGAKRNRGCALAHGSIIIHWDDDDWHALWRISWQAAALEQHKADLCGLDSLLFHEPATGGTWQYRYPGGRGRWVAGGTMCYRRWVWERLKFADISNGEDTRFVREATFARIKVLDRLESYVARVHGGNTCRKQTGGASWHPRPSEMVRKLLGADYPAFAAAGAPAVVEPATAGLYAGMAGAAVPVAAAAGPRVGIGLYVHAEPPRLLETLRALRQHTGRAIDVRILADGADGATLRALAAHPSLAVSATAEPLGAAACFNRLARESDADVLILLESGSIVGPGWLAPILASLAADPANGLAGPSTNTAWGLQAAFPGRGGDARSVARTAADAQSRFGSTWETLEPLYCLADFCYAVKRAVIEAVGPADEGYGLGPCWELDYTVRAVRAGFRPVWAKGSYVFRHPFTQRRRQAEASLFEAHRRRFQDRFCGLRLSGARTVYADHCRGDGCPHFAPLQPPAAGARAGDAAAPCNAVVAVSSPASRARGRGDPGAGASCRPQDPLDCRVAPLLATTEPARRGAGLVSCIMPTRDRPEWLTQAIGYFQRQDYPQRELIILDDGPTDASALIPADDRIRYVRLPGPLSIGAKRNRGVALARGDIIAQWDDDDWYGPGRLSAQVQPIIEGRADITGLTDSRFFDLTGWRFWTCSREVHRRLFVKDVHGGTLTYRRRLFERSVRYPDRSLAEDAVFLSRAVQLGARLVAVACEDHFVYVRHGANSWRFAEGEAVDPAGWIPLPEPAAFAADREFYVRRVA